MILGNEARVIERCIRSAARFIDAICVNANGKDETAQIVERVADELKLPFSIGKDPWVDFGHNRTLSVVKSREFLKAIGWDLSQTYLLLLDADMILEDKGFDVKQLGGCPGFCVNQKNENAVYPNMRLIRADLPWQCLEPTHEYWDLPGAVGDIHSNVLQTLFIQDMNDGGSRSDKTERDRRLLKKRLEEDPTHARTLFYLAETERHSGNFAEAAALYKRRMSAGGYYEEIKFSRYARGVCYKELKLIDEARDEFLEAYRETPERAEPLCELATMLRLKARNAESYVYAKMASVITTPTTARLFIDSSCYAPDGYRALEEIAVTAFYMNSNEIKKEGREAAERILIMPNVPGHIRDGARNNMQFYITRLECTTEKIQVETPRLLSDDGNYRPMNPSIVRTKSGYLMTVRTVNYSQKDSVYTYLDGSGRINTRNLLVTLDKQLKVIGQIEIVDKVGKEVASMVTGIEDIRLFGKVVANSISFTGGNRMTVDVPQIVFGQIDVTTGEVTQKALIIGPYGEAECEKNWLPFVKDSQVHVIHDHDPFLVMRVVGGEKRGEIHVITGEKLYSKEFNRFDAFRGGAGPIPFEDGYLSIVHEVIMKGSERAYWHRFVFYVEKQGQLVMRRVSPLFYFIDKTIEYACGLCSSHDGNEIIVTHGYRDCEAHMSRVKKQTVEKMLKYDL